MKESAITMRENSDSETSPPETAYALITVVALPSLIGTDDLWIARMNTIDEDDAKERPNSLDQPPTSLTAHALLIFLLFTMIADPTGRATEGALITFHILAILVLCAQAVHFILRRKNRGPEPRVTFMFALVVGFISTPVMTVGIAYREMKNMPDIHRITPFTHDLESGGRETRVRRTAPRSQGIRPLVLPSEKPQQPQPVYYG
ncbi:hypothetical protein IEO21_02445 [Rhodonia placenta]|uniref:Uncharacterized protein n=1 Tax=Rhodonia placenta TaxID=104341 RepID=A0A8H7P7K0_9APHY|nr:hypothetical protein IEO21_02445 [Postia placenta]